MESAILSNAIDGKSEPLSGIRVIDLTHSWAGPHCTRLLADYGAEVIRIEYPKRLCFFRGGRTEDKAYDQQTSWYQVNRNKYSLALDLDESADKRMLRELITHADIVVSNSRPGVMTNLGFDYEDLVRLAPNIIMLSMTAFGDTGPYADYCAYGAVMEGVGGIQSLTAYGPDERPQRIREMDVLNGIGAAAAILTALHHRRQTGEGQYIDLSQMEMPTHALIGEKLLEQSMLGNHSKPTGNRSAFFAPQGCYPCRCSTTADNDKIDQWITLSVRNEAEWQSFLQVVDSPKLHKSKRFRTNADRLANQKQLDKLISAWTEQQNARDLMAELQQRGIPAAVVQNVADLCADAHLAARDYFFAEAANLLDGENQSPQKFMGVPFRLKGMRPEVTRGPYLGEHNLLIGTQLLKRHSKDIPLLREEEIGTAYDV